ncbi:ATP synthase subunit I [Thalassospira mesophila]|uniref:ATP synthase subunit I n=1 Tax=Thalassospira mesophila TaxID=1293891 RepID=A0A1Y2KV58_9PROT|nr:ATP synthase subunit I [Thalassospira mesophila]OSQ35406.1 hypothetical protein TMES_21395 [Thalassospira mesophila]
MMSSDTLPLLLLLPFCFAGGVLLGILYFRCIKVTADLIVSGRKPVLAIALAIARLGLLAGGFALALQTGGFGIIAVLAGVIVGRECVIRRKRGAQA